MAEGVSEATGDVLEGTVLSRPPEPGPDDQAAPHGWMWDSGQQKWRARRRPGRAGRRRAAEDEQAPRAEDRAADRDPDPGWAGGQAPPGPPPVGKETIDDIASMLALLYSIPADFLIEMDPYCFGELNANLDRVINATVPIICRSPRVVQFVVSNAGMILWVKLAAELRPFLVAVFQHHIMKTVTTEKDEKTGKTTATKADFSVYKAA